MKTDRFAALPLLLMAVLLAAGTAALLVPLFTYPPCEGTGFISLPSPRAVVTFECRLCRHSGRIRALPRLRGDHDPLQHLGAETKREPTD